MKKIVFLLITVLAFLATEKISAQARITNQTSKVLTLKAVNGNGEIIVKAYERARISFAPFSGAFSFDLYSYEGVNERYVASFTKNVKNGEFQITTKDLTGESQEPSVNTAKAKVEVPEVVYQPSNFRTTNLELTNSSDFKFVVLNGPFAGLALAPGQSSTNSISTPTGLLEMTLKHDVQQESSSSQNKVAHGRSYRQSVFSGIVVENQKKLEIKNENLTFFEGKAVRTMALSMIPYKIVFTAGPWKGQALNNRGYTTKSELSEGFNSFSIQYVGTDGLKYQADIEVIVTPRDRPLIFRETDIKNKMRIKQ